MSILALSSLVKLYYLKWFIAATMSVPTSIPLKIRLNTICINILIDNLIEYLFFFHIFFKTWKQPDWQHLHIVKENQSQQEESECVRLLKLLDIKPHVLSLWRMLEELYYVTISHLYLCTIENYLLIINFLNRQNVSLLFIFNIHPK